MPWNPFQPHDFNISIFVMLPAEATLKIDLQITLKIIPTRSHFLDWLLYPAASLFPSYS